MTSPRNGIKMDSDASEWDYEGDLEIFKIKLAQSTVKERETVRGPLITLRDQIPNSEFESNNLNVLSKPVNLVHVSIQEHHSRKRINPLEIDFILSLVLGYLPLNSLLNCRLVKRDWNTKAVHWIRKKQDKKIEIKSEDFPWFCMDFVKCNMFPLTKLEFTLDGLYLNRGGDFFTQHGSRILDLKIKDFKDYHLNWCPDETNRENLKRLQHILRHVPNLKELTLLLVLLPLSLSDEFIFSQPELSRVTLTHVTYLYLYSRNLLTTKLLVGLLEMLPNANDVVLHVYKFQEQRIALVTSLQKFKFRFNTISSFPNFERLGLWSAITSSQRLKKLKLHVHSETVDNVDLQESMLKSQSECLEELSLCSYIKNKFHLENENVCLLNLPVMTNVRTLNLNIQPIKDNPDPAPLPKVPVEPYQLPNLHSLLVCSRTIELGMFVNSAFKSVQDLKVEALVKNCGQLQAMADRFPNLKKLHLNTNLGVNEVKLIVTSWANLEVLELKICGGREQVNNFSWVFGGVLDLSNPSWAHLAFHVPHIPSLCDLKHLKKLVLTFDTRGRNECFRIDLMGVHWTFLRLSRNLRLYFKGDFKISTELAALLTAHYQNIYFVPKEQITTM